jgi:hypothetical protein
VDFSSVRIGDARALTLRNWGEELVECEGGTIVAAGENAGRRFVVLGWDLLQSDFPLRVGFPIFVTNCMEWLGGSSGAAVNIAARTGDVIPIEAPGCRNAVLTCPDDSSTTLPINGDTAYFDGTERAGVYKVRAKNREWELACNLLSADESNTAPRGDLEVGERKVASAAGGIRSNREFWRIILILGLSLLVFEWYAFHRRIG